MTTNCKGNINLESRTEATDVHFAKEFVVNFLQEISSFDNEPSETEVDCRNLAKMAKTVFMAERSEAYSSPNEVMGANPGTEDGVLNLSSVLANVTTRNLTSSEKYSKRLLSNRKANENSKIYDSLFERILIARVWHLEKELKREQALRCEEQRLVNDVVRECEELQKQNDPLFESNALASSDDIPDVLTDAHMF